MPLQDLTPQLRTRLNRMEKIMGWFILAATALMIIGFAYYLYRAAEDRGWFEVKAPYMTYADSGEGLTVGDTVKLMGFPIGRITMIAPVEARRDLKHNVKILFEVVGTNNYPYIWTGNSHADFVNNPFGGTHLNITRGTLGYGTYINFPVSQMSLADLRSSSELTNLSLGEEIFVGTNMVSRAWVGMSTNLDKLTGLGLSNVWVIKRSSRTKGISSVWNPDKHRYEEFVGTNIYILPPDTEPALMDRVNDIVAQVETALPNFLALTNQLARTLANSEVLTSNLNAVATGIQPALADVRVITANLRDPHGSLGEWLIPTNLNQEIAATLVNANGAITNVNGTLTNVNTNITIVFDDVGRSLINLADLTSNLNYQVQVNSNMLSEISRIIVNSDDFVQGLKRHWLLRSAFKNERTNAPKEYTPVPSRK